MQHKDKMNGNARSRDELLSASIKLRSEKAKHALTAEAHNQPNQTGTSAVVAKTNQIKRLGEAVQSKEVDVLVIGGGPAALGLIINALKTNR